MLAEVRSRLVPLADGATALVACSGGPDSTALAVLVRRARPDLALVLATVAHGLRGPRVDEGDASHVAALAAALDGEHDVLPVTVERSGAGLEADARRARHAALEVAAGRHGAAAILLGHHAEDQAETLLLRAARGTGLDGLGGMSPVAGRRLRPLLAVRRADLHRAARSCAPDLQDAARHDPMNDDPDVARVRLRRELLPALARIGPDPVGALVRLADLARDEAAALEANVDVLVASLPVVEVGEAVAVPSAGLRAASPALARRVLRRLLGAADAATLERLLAAPDGWRATLPGPLDASVERGWHLLAPVGPAPDVAPHPLDPAPGTTVEVVHAPSSLRLRASRAHDADGPITELAVASALPLPPGLRADRRTVRLRGDGPLTVRTRRPGERIRLPAGSRAVSDVMLDAGVPRVLRDRLPVVADAADRAVWVPGLAVDAGRHVRRAHDHAAGATGRGGRPQ